MASNLAFIEKTLPGVFDEVRFTKSLTKRFFRNNAIIKGWENGGRTVKIFNLGSSGYTNYNRGGHGQTNSKGSIVSRLESFDLKQERWADFEIDGLDSFDDQETVLGRIAKHFADTQHTYEIDAYDLSKIADYASTTIGNKVVETVDNNTIYGKLNKGFKWLANKHVDKKDIVIFASVSAMAEIRATDELYKTLEVGTTTEDYNGKSITFDVVKLNGCEIVEVPDDTFYTNAVPGDNGIAPGVGSKLINFIICDKNAPVAAENVAWVKMYSSDTHRLDFYGSELQCLTYYDLMVPENASMGIYVSVSTADAVARELSVDVVAGAASGKAKLRMAITNPEGIAYDKVCLYTTNGTAPAIGASTASLTEVQLGAEFTPNGTHNIFVASLDGKAVAVSKDFTNTLPVGA